MQRKLHIRSESLAQLLILATSGRLSNNATDTEHTSQQQQRHLVPQHSMRSCRSRRRPQPAIPPKPQYHLMTPAQHNSSARASTQAQRNFLSVSSCRMRVHACHRSGFRRRSHHPAPPDSTGAHERRRAECCWSLMRHPAQPARSPSIGCMC